MSYSPVFLSAETVLHRFNSPSPDPRFERLLYLAAGTELLKMGVSSKIEDGAAAEYSFSAEYSITDGVATIAYGMFLRDSPENPISEEKTDLRIDSSFDAAVAATVRGLVARAGIVFVRDPNAYIDGILAFPHSSEGFPETIKSEAVEEPVIEPEQAESRRAGGFAFELSVSAFGMALLGDITRFIHYGAGSEIYAGASWPFDRWTISAGIKAGAARAFNDPGVSGGPLGIWTAQASLMLGSNGTPGSAVASVSAGAAVLSVASADGAKSKTVPCADAGISALLPIGKGFSLGLGVGLRAFFDAPFIPAITTSILVRWGA